MLTIFKRGEIYHVRGTIRRGGGRIRQSTGTTDEGRARQVADQLEAEAWQRYLQGGGQQSGTFAEAMNVYLDNRDPGPAERRRLTKLLDHFGRMRCNQIDQVALDAYLRVRHPHAKGATKIRETIRPLSSVLRYGAKRKWCDQPDFDLPSVDRFDGARALKPEEANRLIKAAARHLRPIIIFLLGTGCRTNDALRLRWEDVDLAAPQVTFRKPKTGNAYTVPLRAEVVDALSALPHREGIVFRTPRGGEYHDGRGLGGNPLKTGFKAACRRAGIGHVRVHDTRHSFTTWRVLEGISLPIVARLRGDKNVQMVMRYAHLQVDDLAAALKGVDVDTKQAHSRGNDVQPTEKKG